MSDDLIKRSDAIDELMHIIPYKLYHNGEYIFLLNKRECLKVIKAIPSADRPQGEWIEVTNGRGGHECSNCHEYAPSYMSGNEHLSDYCPNCGAMMKGANNETEMF